MARTREIEGIILSAKRSGESNKLICCLAADEMFHAQVYGAYKGKSRNGANCEMFSTVRLYTYLNPVKNQTSVKDSVLLKTCAGIRGSLGKIFTASLMCELIEKSYAGGGEYSSMLDLLAESLDLLDGYEKSEAGQASADYLLIQFMLRFLEFSGSGFYAGLCQNCGKLTEGTVYYSFHSSEIVCADCTSGDAAALSNGIVNYISFTLGKGLAPAAAVRLADADRVLLKGVLIQHIQAVGNITLKSLAAGEMR